MECKYCGSEMNKTDWGYYCENCKKGVKSCSSNTEVYSRVVGFYRPVEQWNNGKKEEFKERKTYNVNL